MGVAESNSGSRRHNTISNTNLPRFAISPCEYQREGNAGSGLARRATVSSGTNMENLDCNERMLRASTSSGTELSPVDESFVKVNKYEKFEESDYKASMDKRPSTVVHELVCYAKKIFNLFFR